MHTYKDGTYVAETAKFDYGWKTKMELTVKMGKISKVEISSFNEKGQNKKEDVKYNERWKEKAGTNFIEFADKYEKEILAKQDPSKLDTVAGATSVSELSKKMLAELLKAAKAGNTETIIIK